MSFNKAIVSVFIAASSSMLQAAPVDGVPERPDMTQKNAQPMTPENRASILSLAKIKLERARDPAHAGLESWSMLHYVQIYLGYARYDLNSDDGYTALGISKKEFYELLDKHVALGLQPEIDQMRNPGNKGLDALGSIDLILQAVTDLQLTRHQTTAEILSSFGTTQQEIEKASIDHARLGAQQILDSVKSNAVAGAEGWTALMDMRQYMKRARLDSRSNAGFKAINSSLAEYQQLKRKHAMLAVTTAWEMANQPQHAGDDAVYYLDLVETYLRRAGYNTSRGEGFSEIKTTKEEFQRLVEKNTTMKRNNIAPIEQGWRLSWPERPL